jgi:hypothetical protein
MNEMQAAINRIVWPIRASMRRKEKMREEMTAHLTGILEQEKRAGLPEHEAVARALERFGDPAEVRRQLQSAVPRLERVVYAPIPFLTPGERLLDSALNAKPGESAVWHAARVTGLVALIIGSLYFLIFLALAIPDLARGAFPQRAAECARTMWAILAPGALCSFLALLLGHGILRLSARRPRGPREWALAWLCMILLVPVAGGCGLLSALIARPDLAAGPLNWVSVVGGNLDFPFPFWFWVGLVPLGVMILVGVILAEGRRRRDWEGVWAE